MPQADTTVTLATTRASRGMLYFVAFWSGFAVLTIEIAGARLIAPVFGLSSVPWTAVIGVILLALAVGNHFGGRLADSGRFPLWMILSAAGLTSVIPVLGSELPVVALRVFGFIPGAVVSALVLFGPSILCLGAIVPHLIRADTTTLEEVGRRAGSLSAIATAGSILGTFVTGFVLIAIVEVPVLLGLTGCSLLLTAAFVGRHEPRGTAGLVVLSCLLGASGWTVDRTGTVHAEETIHSSIRIKDHTLEDGSVVRQLYQNGSHSSTEFVETGEPASNYVAVSLELLAPALTEAEAILILGGAALTLPVAIQKRYPQLQIQVVEIDPAVTSLARRYFSYGRQPYPNIAVHHGDARVWIRGTDQKFDVIYIDVFDHLVSIPWVMITKESFEEIENALTPEGMVVVNTISAIEGARGLLAQSIVRTLQDVFEEQRAYQSSLGHPSRASQNLLLFASHSTRSLPTGDPRRIDIAPFADPLTDAWAPVEFFQIRHFLSRLWPE